MTEPVPDREAVGTLLRHLLELLDGELAERYGRAGLADYRPRYSPVIRALAAEGPMPIRDLARSVGVTHSAASQTVRLMTRSGLLTLEPGADARTRVANLTARAKDLLPFIEADWAATAAAMRELDAELPMPLGDVLVAVVRALQRRPLRERLADGPQEAEGVVSP
ncbi:MarR family transcriptional regulator [Spongiactinospora rosea]|uniref:MarR family transcriptional regulator n=2 Tax=Spongiactinospora rosea TaxID=2248750 RepID=A0A366M938_9ACTN|nr:MarR family transcriptional regulator [Spongiactinospora rosea]